MRFFNKLATKLQAAFGVKSFVCSEFELECELRMRMRIRMQNTQSLAEATNRETANQRKKSKKKNKRTARGAMGLDESGVALCLWNA